jgi:hypothetical protein
LLASSPCRSAKSTTIAPIKPSSKKLFRITEGLGSALQARSCFAPVVAPVEHQFPRYNLQHVPKVSYNLNDETAPIGASHWAALANQLPRLMMTDLGSLTDQGICQKSVPRRTVRPPSAEIMVVQQNIDKAQFAAAMASVYPEFEKRFGRELIEKIRQAG